MTALRNLATGKSLAHRRQFIGHSLEAITLHTPEPLAARGRTLVLTELRAAASVYDAPGFMNRSSSAAGQRIPT